MNSKEGLFWVFFLVKGLTLSLATSCPSEWKNTPYGCFWPVKSSYKYEDAKRFCKVKSAHLITAVRNLSLILRKDFFEKSPDFQRTDIFIGLRKTNNSWYWEDGVRAGNALVKGFSNEASRLCARIETYGNYEIKDVSCAGHYKFICEKKINVLVSSISEQSHAGTSPVSTSLPISSVSTNVPAVYSTPWLKSTSISENPYEGYTTVPPSLHPSDNSDKSLPNITTTSSDQTPSLLFVTSRAVATSRGGLLQISSSEVSFIGFTSSLQIQPSSSHLNSTISVPSSSASYISEVTQNMTETALMKDVPWSVTFSSPLSTTIQATIKPSGNIPLSTIYQLAPASNLPSPNLSSKPSSSTVYAIGVLSSSCSEEPFNVSSTRYKNTEEEMAATVGSDSNTLNQAMSATSVIHIIPSTSVGLVTANDSLNEKNKASSCLLVTKYLQQIGGLDSTLSTSAKFASELTTNLLESFSTCTSGKLSGKPVMAVDKFEEFLYQYAKQHLNYSNREIYWNTTSMAVQMMRIYEPSEDVQFHSPNNDVSIYFPRDNLENGTILVQVLYDALHLILPSLFRGNTGKFQIGSKITSILQGFPSNQTTLKSNVTISFKNLKEVQGPGTLDDLRKCVFWSFLPRDGTQNNGEWSDEGCTVICSSDDQTLCNCNHLTIFAVLMQTTEEDRVSSFDHHILSLLTIVGLGLSLFGSTLTFLAYITLTDRKSDQSQIRINLVASLWMAHFLFLTGIHATHIPVICVMVGALLQLFFLASLCWMLVEGIQLYYRIVRVYNAEVIIKGCYLFAWGFPVLVVCISLVISSFGPKGVYGFVKEDICWVSHYLYLAWIFAVPVSLILLANLIFFLRVMKEISRMEIRQPKQQRVSVVRRNLKACLRLFPLLGITWFAGCFIMFHSHIVLIYIFTILNSTQGFFIFLFHCVGNREIRSAFKKKIYPNDLPNIEKRNQPIPLAIASVSNGR